MEGIVKLSVGEERGILGILGIQSARAVKVKALIR